jgi:hypothetical protein
MEPALHFPKAKDLFDEIPAAGEDILARPTDEPSLEFLVNLARSPTPEEAISFGAYLLPKRKAVWWGHECVRSLIHLLTDQDLRMLGLAEAWVRDPEEPQRVAAMVEAMAARQKSPGVMIALAAAWSGGSMADASLPKIPPPPYLTPRAVNGGILSALARVDVRHRATTLGAFVEMGVSLATR